MIRDLRWLLVALLAAMVGCPSPLPSVSTQTSQPGEVEGSSVGDSKSQRCQELMDGVMRIFDLQQLDLQSDVQDGLRDLNRWLEDCGERTAARDPIPPSILKLFSKEDLAALSASRFSLDDAEHLRTCLVLKAQAAYAAGQAQSPREQAENLFEYVIRTIALAEPAEALPFTPHEVCLLGRGTASDRAWLFAGLLRHVKIDSVRLRPRGTEPGVAGLIAVLLKEDGQPKTYLFDLLRGVALRTEARLSAPLASLSDAIAKPELLGGWHWTAESLSNPHVGLIGSRSLWSTRLSQFQPQFAGERSMPVSDPLVDTDLGPGYVARVLGGSEGRWTGDSLELWMPEDAILAARRVMRTETKAAIERALSPRLAPMAPVMEDANVVYDSVTNLVKFSPPSRVHWRARLEQLGGDFPRAIVDYLRVRGEAHDLKSKTHWRVDPELLALNDRAIEDTWYFLGECQFQQGRHAEAVVNFKKVLLLRPEGGGRANAARRSLALCQAALGKQAEAVATLKQLPDGDPQRAWSEIRISEWSR